MTAYPTWNPDAPEESFNNLIRQLELRDDDLREGNYRAITGNQLQEKTVGTVNLRDQAITSDKIEDGSIIHVKLGVSSVWGDKLGLEAVSGGHIKVSAVSAGHLDSNSVITAKIATGAVTGPKIAVSAVSAGHLDSNSVTTPKIGTSAVTRDKLDLPVQIVLGPYLGAAIGVSVGAGNDWPCFVGQTYKPRPRASTFFIDTSISTGSLGLVYHCIPSYVAPKQGRLKAVSFFAHVWDTFSAGLSVSDNLWRLVPLLNEVSVNSLMVQASVFQGSTAKGFTNSNTGVPFNAGDQLSLIFVRDGRADSGANVPPFSLQGWLNIELDN